MSLVARLGASFHRVSSVRGSATKRHAKALWAVPGGHGVPIVAGLALQSDCRK